MIFQRSPYKKVANDFAQPDAFSEESKWWVDPIIMPDSGAPTDGRIEPFVKLMDPHQTARESVVVHCVAGCGTAAVAWCAKAGFIPAGEWGQSGLPKTLADTTRVSFQLNRFKLKISGVNIGHRTWVGLIRRRLRSEFWQG